MKRSKLKRTALTVCMLSVFHVMSFRVPAQTTYGSQTVNTVIEGTSNIHDWELISSRGSCTMLLNLDATGKLTGIGNVQYVIQVNTLKSKHGSQLDNNAYKAMNAEDHPVIRFSGTNGSLKPAASGTRDVVLTAMVKVNADRSVTIDGVQQLKTTDYNIKAISIMLGAIKTSPDVTVKYNMNVRPQ